MTARWLRRPGTLLLISLWAGPAPAADLADFFGRWRGEALAETRGGEAGQVSNRDLEVVIGPEGDGFAVTWTTVLEADRPESERKTTGRSFRPSGRPGIWRTRGPDDPLRQAGYAWARLRDDTLSVFTLRITDSGGYEMHVYDRTLDGERMRLRFTRLEDGRVVRLASGRLTRDDAD